MPYVRRLDNEVYRERDVPDAEMWITRAALLGVKLNRLFHNNRIAWRWEALRGEETIAYADWPGAVAQLAVEYIQSEK